MLVELAVLVEVLHHLHIKACLDPDGRHVVHSPHLLVLVPVARFHMVAVQRVWVVSFRHRDAIVAPRCQEQVRHCSRDLHLGWEQVLVHVLRTKRGHTLLAERRDVLADIRHVELQVVAQHPPLERPRRAAHIHTHRRPTSARLSQERFLLLCQLAVGAHQCPHYSWVGQAFLDRHPDVKAHYHDSAFQAVWH